MQAHKSLVGWGVVLLFTVRQFALCTKCFAVVDNASGFFFVTLTVKLTIYETVLF